MIKMVDVERIIKLHISGLSVKQIAIEMALGVGLVRRRLISAGRKIVPRYTDAQIKAQQDAVKYLDDKDWVYDQYITQGGSPTSIGTELGISGNRVKKALSKHGIAKRDHTKAQQNRRRRTNLQNNQEEIDLAGELYAAGMSANQIRKELGLGNSATANRLRSSGVELRNQKTAAEKEALQQSLSLLADKDWLYEEYVTQKRSTNSVASDLSVTTERVNAALKLHNIPKRTHQESQRNRTERGDDRLDRKTGFNSPEDLELLRSLYEDDEEIIRDIASAVGLGVDSVTRRLRKAGATLRTGFGIPGRTMTIETRAKMSATASQQIRDGTRASGGRGKASIEYSPLQGDVRVRSSYEKEYLQYLVKNNIHFLYESRSFKLSIGKTYTPDFYLIESDTYIEIKGFLSDSDKRKYAAFKADYPDIKWKMINKAGLKALGLLVGKR